MAVNPNINNMKSPKMTMRRRKNTLPKRRHSFILDGRAVKSALVILLSTMVYDLLSILYLGVKPSIGDINNQIGKYNDYGENKSTCLNNGVIMTEDAAHH